MFRRVETDGAGYSCEGVLVLRRVRAIEIAKRLEKRPRLEVRAVIVSYGQRMHPHMKFTVESWKFRIKKQ